MKKCEAFMHLC